MTRRVLVCGGRDFDNAAWLRLTLDELHAAEPYTLLIEGGAGGADRLAREWATTKGIPVATFDAEWMAHGRRAGPIRNQRMLEEGQPDEVVAFPGGRGTADMVRRARAAGITVLVFTASVYSNALRGTP